MIDAVPGVRLLQDLHTLKAINKVTLFSCTNGLSGVPRLGLSSPLLAKQPSHVLQSSQAALLGMSGSRGKTTSAAVGAPLPHVLVTQCALPAGSAHVHDATDRDTSLAHVLCDAPAS